MFLLIVLSSAVAAAAALICVLAVTHWVQLPGRLYGKEADLLEQCWRILICCIFAGLCLELTATLIFGEVTDTTLIYAKQLLFNVKGDDSWYPMLKASAQLRDHPDASIYQVIFFDQRIKFQYPLSALLLIDVPRWVSIWMTTTFCLWHSLFPERPCLFSSSRLCCCWSVPFAPSSNGRVESNFPSRH